MKLFMKANGDMELNVVKVDKCGLMVLSMKDIGKIIWLKAKVD